MKKIYSKQEMYNLRDQGMRNSQIAKHLGCCIQTVLRNIGPDGMSWGEGGVISRTIALAPVASKRHEETLVIKAETPAVKEEKIVTENKVEEVKSIDEATLVVKSRVINCEGLSGVNYSLDSKHVIMYIDENKITMTHEQFDDMVKEIATIIRHAKDFAEHENEMW